MSTLRTRLVAAGLGLVTLFSLSACSTGSVGSQQSTKKESGNGSSSSLSTTSDVKPDPNIVASSKALVAASTGSGDMKGFTPPTGGPKAQKPGAAIAYVEADPTNPAIVAVGTGLKEAAAVLGWTVNSYNGQGSTNGRTDALNQAIATNPAAIVLGGFDATEQASVIKTAADKKIPVIAWHAGPNPGPAENIINNVTTRGTDVANVAGAYIIADSNGKAGVSIFTDNQYSVAVAKSNAIRDYILKSADAKVLAYNNSPIASTNANMPGLISNQVQQFGSAFTYMVGVNGNYCAGAQPTLKQLKDAPKCVAAGDGVADEFQRIKTGDGQAATVADPIYLESWEIADDINRTFAGEKISGFVPSPVLITQSNVGLVKNGVFDPASNYRAIYKSNWGK